MNCRWSYSEEAERASEREWRPRLLETRPNGDDGGPRSIIRRRRDDQTDQDRREREQLVQALAATGRNKAEAAAATGRGTEHAGEPIETPGIELMVKQAECDPAGDRSSVECDVLAPPASFGGRPRERRCDPLRLISSC